MAEVHIGDRVWIRAPYHNPHHPLSLKEYKILSEVKYRPGWYRLADAYTGMDIGYDIHETWLYRTSSTGQDISISVDKKVEKDGNFCSCPNPKPKVIPPIMGKPCTICEDCKREMR